MKIMHIVAGELSGGAARGAYCLHQGLIELGVDSNILTNSKDTLGDPRVESINRTKKQKIVNIVRAQLDQLPTCLYPKRKRVIFSTSFIGYDFTKHPLYKWADIIHLHWINGGFVNIRHLSKVKKPIIWTMRDMWPMTGGCHVAYAMDCEKYKNGCGKCKQLKSKYTFDLSKAVFIRKKKYVPKNITMVGISQWLSECAKKSELFRNIRVETIHNNVNCNEFFPVEKKNARGILGFPEDKNIILVGAQGIESFYKGFDKFLGAMRKIKKRENLFLLVFGKCGSTALDGIDIDYNRLGFLHDTISLRLVYSASDVFVAPSIMDAFGKTLAEAMACGTPVVCFNATGPKDIVDHKINGYKAQPFDTIDLAKGIDWVLDNPEYEKLRQNARKKVLEEFEMVKVAGQYKKLYEEILAE